MHKPTRTFPLPYVIFLVFDEEDDSPFLLEVMSGRHILTWYLNRDDSGWEVRAPSKYDFAVDEKDETNVYWNLDVAKAKGLVQFRARVAKNKEA
jgi:hypothetical protein